MCEVFTNADAAKDLEFYQNGLPDAIVDFVLPSVDGTIYEFLENQNIKDLLSSHSKAILFAVPGAFTPTCSSKHLPGFITHANQLYEKGVEAIYCLSVNDKFVMKAWAEVTKNSLQSRIKFIADGNADFTTAINAQNDRRSGRMGIRSQRYVIILLGGKITHVLKDLSVFSETSAENILSYF